MKILIGVAKFIVGVGVAIGLLSILMAILSRFVKRPTNLGVSDGKLALCPNMPNCVQRKVRTRGTRLPRFHTTHHQSKHRQPWLQFSTQWNALKSSM